MEEVKREQKKELTNKEVKFSDILNTQLANIGKGLPKELNTQRFVANCITLLNENPTLQHYSKQDLCVGLMKGAILGLDFLSKECYLIPYGSKLNFQTDYKGDVKIARRYAKRPVQDIYAKLVKEGDLFESGIKENQTYLNHEERSPFDNSKKIVGVYAVVRYKDGGIEYETMSTEEIEQVRQAFSKSKNSPAWQNTWGEMAKKTCLRRLCKHITIDLESVERQLAFEEGSDSNFKQVRASEDKVDVIDVSSQAVDESEVVEQAEGTTKNEN